MAYAARPSPLTSLERSCLAVVAIRLAVQTEVDGVDHSFLSWNARFRAALLNQKSGNGRRIASVPHEAGNEMTNVTLYEQGCRTASSSLEGKNALPGG